MINFEIEKQIAVCVSEVLPNAEFDKETLLESVGMDSMNYIRLVVELEDAFHVEIEDKDITLETFATVSSICTLISRYVVRQ